MNKIHLLKGFDLEKNILYTKCGRDADKVDSTMHIVIVDCKQCKKLY